MKNARNADCNATERNASDILHAPFDTLVRIASTEKGLALIIGVAYNAGIQLGRRQTHDGYSRMFKGYNEHTIKS